MPYFVFSVQGFGQLQLLGTHEAFKPASLQAKALRADPAHQGAAIKVMFGNHQLEAEDQLLQQRERTPQGDDD